ncbi:MAG: DUF1003 domain-containing protein [Candidatus Pacebacteria bacterium]|nr:DUF1003 domain-containing protein [Candidatus Paceibacterota bacterium]MBP9772770.1 DUF1003 domain-containing protein [Candidatus Paceibacterota bacterium]QQR76669.1 MAG: DUF1003 domain-containing protein [Candidatus Nomurabacteria bacterium]
MSNRERLQKKGSDLIEGASVKATKWIGSVASLVVHTILFIGAFLLILVGFERDTILLVVTTIVSLEAIYLSIFIQMTVNRHTEELHDVSEDVEEIQKDVDEIQEDVEEIQKDVDEIQEDVEDLGEDVDEISGDSNLTLDQKTERIAKDIEILKNIEERLRELSVHLADIKKKKE